MRRSPLTAAVLAAALSLGVVACGSDAGNGSNQVQPGATATTCAPSTTEQAMGGNRPNDTLVGGAGQAITGGQPGGNSNVGGDAGRDTSSGNPSGDNSATGQLPGPGQNDAGGAASGDRGIGNGTGAEAGSLGTC